ncbi:phage tail protein [Hydrogenovibrio sp. 3SP14C1]|uniref:phage tail protein n=1 Tax=Hydrogenovibrio sp. 3SP14C1 TaxID=3038774 RepID=UPI002416696B|nr:phage tail protein [Hydrogenovibrio sp. 3SP14C1]MDG4811651.1 phage tail protein [Hydrogenovibrio sp. 3SP14C1]
MADIYDDVITNLKDLSRLRETADAVGGQLSNSGSVMMMLGPFIFSIDTAAYNSLTHTVDYMWAGIQRIGGRKASQFGGIASDTIKMPGVIYPHYAGGLYQMQAVRELASLGKPLPMVDGRGKIWGEFTIKRVEETLKVLTKGGAPMKIEFNLSLEYYSRQQSSQVADLIKGVL